MGAAGAPAAQGAAPAAQGAAAQGAEPPAAATVWVPGRGGTGLVRWS
jgi:hypothetical protein